MASKKTPSVAEIAKKRDRVQPILEKFKRTETDWSEIHRLSMEDLKFYNGEQFDEQQARAARQLGNKVQIKLNMIAQYVQQVDNMRRQADIALTCHPTDEAGSEETAQVYEGIFRHIEDISSAKHAYNAAFGPTGALVAGLGFIKVDTDYVDNNSFDQEIKIVACRDSNKILPDFNAKCPVMSDAEYWFEFDDVTKEDFEAQYPGAMLSSFPNWTGMSKQSGGWIGQKMVRLAKYWYKEAETYTLVQYEDGTMGLEDEEIPLVPYTVDELADMEQEKELKRKAFNGSSGDPSETETYAEEVNEDAVEPDAEELALPLLREARVIKTRTIQDATVKWIITNGYEILEEGTWHNQDFPFVPCIGQDMVIDGKRTMHGITRYAREPQQIVNYLSSELVRKTAATTKSQWMIDVDAVPKQFLKDWMSSNVNEKAVLFYTSKANGRENIPSPQRLDMAEPQMSNLLQSIGKSMNDIKQTLGLTPQSADAMTGKPEGNQSGVAINSLAQQGELANFHFSDNTVLSMKRLGELVIRLIPFIYDTPRTIRIINPDSSAELVKINQLFSEEGKDKSYDMSAGSYGVVIDTGPGFATKKAMRNKEMIALASIDPELAAVMAPGIVRNSDWDVDGSVEDVVTQWAAQKFPWLKMDSKTDIPPQAKATILQLQNQVATLGQHFNQAVQEITTLKNEQKANTLDNDAKIRLALIDRQTKLDLKRADMMLELQTTKDNIRQIEIQAQLDHMNKTREHILGHIQHIDRMART